LQAENKYVLFNRSKFNTFAQSGVYRGSNFALKDFKEPHN
jgi:hypothetical protein